ncbi:MAG: methane/phenol/toluene hydroxylase [Amycolatopsis sp.]|jgi:propane monooxygenase small subunit|uniref:aromatic/alkene monooxygenase hydroxylase subunit beta n=1 Tax=Amycolatopsis sp. TaxID=37632 RepID=UPI0026118E2F|nr:aromatic/alkene monooxygenase hydroxylase subunit beta [Amycolatopsis sp.]MCU1683583.1 methane/phenol/toluene hydroxylase [Amycolatopsis sp.]
MVSAEKVQPQSFPKPEFTGAEAGLLDFPSSKSRSYNYFKPKKLRATMYEDVTMDVQPDPERHLSQGWLYGFANSPGGYPPEWTAVKSTDWHLFLDPNEEWEQTIYRNNANTVRQIERTLSNAKAAGAYKHWTPSWTKFVENHVGAWMHAEHGLGMHVFMSEQRSAPTNMINNAIAVNCVHKLRFAQDLALYNLDLSESEIEFDGSAHKASWQSAPVWQGVRENVERLTAIGDWAESLFAANVVFESLVGSLFRSHLVMQIAARNGDYVTPTVVGAGEHDYDRDRRYSKVLFAMLTADEQHGEANKETMQGWMDTWVPISVQAARELQPIWSQPHEKVVTFAESWEAALTGFRTLLSDLNLSEPKGLDL